ncbi:MAG: hypothetical protein ACREOZ_03455, partial [Gloeomargaritales cyanobacterium]
DLGYISEPMFFQMRLDDMRQACRDRGLFTHKGTRFFRPELTAMLTKWNHTYERRSILESTANNEDQTFTDIRAAADALIAKLRKAGFDLPEGPVQSRTEVHFYLIRSKNIFDSDTAVYNVHRAAVAYIQEKDPSLVKETRGDVATETETQSEKTDRPPPQSMSKNEYVRVVHCYSAPENCTVVQSITHSLTREELDARKSSSAYEEPWDVIAVMFDSNKQFTHPAPLNSKIKDIDPNSFRPGRDGNTLKKCYNRLKTAFSIVHAKWAASGQQGSEDKDGRIDLEDHFEEEGKEA